MYQLLKELLLTYTLFPCYVSLSFPLPPPQTTGCTAHAGPFSTNFHASLFCTINIFWIKNSVNYTTQTSVAAKQKQNALLQHFDTQFPILKRNLPWTEFCSPITDSTIVELSFSSVLNESFEKHSCQIMWFFSISPWQSPCPWQQDGERRVRSKVCLSSICLAGQALRPVTSL
jgi:hypothetical protein